MTDKDLIAEARFYESPGHVAAYSEEALDLLNNLADALEARQVDEAAEEAEK